jgi:polar amino acid transport system substrate-binding protein
MQSSTISQRVYLLLVALLMIAFCTDTAVSQEINLFRHVDSAQVSPPETVTTEVRLLTDEDFAPYSYKNAAGELVGISVDIATAACAAARLQCQISAVPFIDLLPALARGEGDAIISGLRMAPKMMKDFSLTRPYYVSSAQFLTRLGSSFTSADVKALAGKRLGFVNGTSHQAFLDKYYGRSALTGFGSEAEMFENLRTGGLDAAFADVTHAYFWVQGKASRACCDVLGQSFFDRSSISRSLAFLVKRDKTSLRENLDYGLDQAQLHGDIAKIFKRYFPKASF